MIIDKMDFKTADKEQFKKIIEYYFEKATQKELDELYNKARKEKQKIYKDKVFFRGLIEFTTFCHNECYYCGLCRSNKKAIRYRLTEEDILSCCKFGYKLGFRTFVLQGGEDNYFTDEKIVNLVKNIKKSCPGAAVTLSIGEKNKKSYQKYFDAGTDRYLLRHETSNEEHYQKLHDKKQTLKNRIKCLKDLKEIGFQTGAGFMVDSPYQTYENLAEDMIFLRELNPEMIGLGPFIPHKDTKFKDYYEPVPKHTLVMLALVRIMLPRTLLPATTALGTALKDGREIALLGGANVLMPNLSPPKHKDDYKLYDGKINTGLESGENLIELAKTLETFGLEPDFGRGDYKKD